MKTQYLTASLLFAAAAAGLSASPSVDRKIEKSAEESYNYRKVLDDKVKVSAQDGVVTLTGKVPDRDDKQLAQATVESIPGVSRVDNRIVVDTTMEEKSDSWIALKVRSRLLVKSNVSAANTKVDVKDGVVLLTGTTDNVAQKELTEVYAKEIEGVKSVENKLVVKDNPDTRSTAGEKIDDASITTQVKVALVRHKSTSALKTKVDTNDGVITITGEANSDAEKALVTKLARDVRGVRSVDNRMTVRN
jgi:hyperosmotically inducible protein